LTAPRLAEILRRTVDSTRDELMVRLNRDALVIARRFDLRYRVIEAERPRVKRRYGVCYADGTIRIRLQHAATGRPLRYSSLVSTLCHELAHLRHFNHGLRFRRFYREVLEYARHAQIYRPRDPRVTTPAPPRREPLAQSSGRMRPVQLALFGGEAG
jgi:predicted metal-dependent hydrolase